MIRTTMGVLAGLAAPSTLAAGIAFFEGSWDEALQEAGETGQLVFVDVYTEWCGPCKLMDANVYPKDAVGDYFNPRFVNVKLDAEDEDVDGPEIADRYDIGAYPTLLFLNPDGSELGRGVAGLEVEQLIQLARELTGAGTSEYAAMQARYEAGERDGAFVQDFLRTAQIEAAKLYGDFEAMRSHRQRMTPVFDAYFEAKDKKALINATDFSVIASYKSKQQRGDSGRRVRHRQLRRLRRRRAGKRPGGVRAGVELLHRPSSCRRRRRGLPETTRYAQRRTAPQSCRVRAGAGRGQPPVAQVPGGAIQDSIPRAFRALDRAPGGCRGPARQARRQPSSDLRLRRKRLLARRRGGIPPTRP